MGEKFVVLLIRIWWCRSDFIVCNGVYFWLFRLCCMVVWISRFEVLCRVVRRMMFSFNRFRLVIR